MATQIRTASARTHTLNMRVSVSYAPRLCIAIFAAAFVMSSVVTCKASVVYVTSCMNTTAVPKSYQHANEHRFTNAAKVKLSLEFAEPYSVTEDDAMVANHDNTVMLTTAHHYRNPSHSSVLVYRKQHNQWAFAQTITNPGDTHSPTFGRALALAKCGAGVLAVGSSRKVHVYESVDGADYELSQTLRGNGKFGSALAMSDDGRRLVVGAPGVAYVHMYERGEDGQFERITSVSYTTVSLSQESRFGTTVACDASCTAMSATAAKVANPFSSRGSVYVFRDMARNNTDFTELLSPENANTVFGRQLAFDADGTVLSVSSLEAVGSRVFVYRRCPGCSAHELFDTLGDDLSSPLFGAAVAIAPNGTSIYVGDRRSEDGYVHHYAKPDDDGPYQPFDMIQAPSSPNGKSGRVFGFGAQLALSAEADSLLVSAPFYPDQDDERSPYVMQFGRDKPFHRTNGNAP